MIKDRTVLERLAALEHEQWVHWAKSVSETETISPERLERWTKFFVPYEELTEEVKEFDREWARKAIEVINNT